MTEEKKKRFEGRRLTKINKHMLAYGKELEKEIFTKDLKSESREVRTWNLLFEKKQIWGWFHHYRDDEGNWREANC